MTIKSTHKYGRSISWFMLLCCFPFLGFSQEMALVKSEPSPTESDGKQNAGEERISLKQVLNDWAEQYHANFNYDSGILHDKYVNKPAALSSAKELDKSLEDLLKPLGLKIKKVDKDIYVIQPLIEVKEIQGLTIPANMKIQASVLSPGVFYQQVSGKVLDENDAPLPGVSIIVKGTNTGTATDAAGAFSIAAEPSNILVFTFIGYISKEVEVGNQTVIDIKLLPDIKALSEVVVTALGIKKDAKKLGYATATVAAEQISVNRTPNFMNTLAGKIPGVNITALGTGPAGTSKIRIRGQSSFGGQNNPLIVVNGVPIDNTNFGSNPGVTGDGSNGSRSTNNASDGGDGLSSINPDDIESMTVLKGGTAGALYGSRAKDGVIMITTKTKGSGRGIGVTWNSNFVSDQPLDYTDYQYEYGQGEQGKRPTAANPESGVFSFGEKFQPGMTQILFNGIEVPYQPVRNHITDFYRVGSTWTNTVSLSSGGEKGGFNLSFANMDNKSIVPNSNYNRKTINLGMTQNITRKLTLSANINYSNEYNRNPPQIALQDLSTPTVLYTMSNSMPLDLLEKYSQDANGNEIVWSRFKNRTNPYFAINNRFENIRRDRVFGNLTLRYNFTDWLYLQGRIGQDYYSRDQDYNYPTGAAVMAGPKVGTANGTYVQESRRFRETNVDFLLGATRKFGDFGVDVTLGGNQRYVRSDLNSVQVDEFVVRGLYTVQNGAIKNPLYSLNERQVNSLYAAAEFSYKEFLYLNVTGRNDWFSTLSPANRSILYPSVSGSFVFSQAFPDLPQWLSFGKIRAAYAEVGSDLDINPYSDKLYYNINANFFPGPPNPNGSAGAIQPVGNISGLTIPNPNLKPMRVSEKEVGLEMKFLNNRVGLDVAYYEKLSRDQILDAQVSDASGYTKQKINVGKSQNRGLEMLLTFVPIQTDNFKWDLSFNGSYNTSKVLSLGLGANDTIITSGKDNQYELGELRQWVGHPIGELFGYGYQRDAQGRQVFNANNGTPLRTSVQIPFGSSIPTWVGGITNAITYKGFSFSVLIDFKLGHKLISGTNHNAYREGLHKATLPGREQNYVIGNGVNPNGEVNQVHTNLQTYYETVRSLRLSEEFVYNAGFWKLRQITLGYDFSKHLPKNMFVKGLRLSAVANNVLILKKWVPNIDPEQFGYSSDLLSGLESTGLPTSRSIGFNLNVKF